MPTHKPSHLEKSRKRRLAQATEVLAALQFEPKQKNHTAAHTLLALLDLRPEVPWEDAQAPLRGITPIINFIAATYGIHPQHPRNDSR